MQLWMEINLVIVAEAYQNNDAANLIKAKGGPAQCATFFFGGVYFRTSDIQHLTVFSSIILIQTLVSRISDFQPYLS